MKDKDTWLDVWVMGINFDAKRVDGILWEVWDHEPSAKEIDVALGAAVDYYGDLDITRRFEAGKRSYPMSLCTRLLEAYTKGYGCGEVSKK